MMTDEILPKRCYNSKSTTIMTWKNTRAKLNSIYIYTWDVSPPKCSCDFDILPLGAGTALLGKKAAMACTVAVEESIASHYNNQIRVLVEEDPEKYKELLQIIKKFRDEEMQHHDTGLDYDAELTPGYSILKNAIQVGCKAAIFLSERI
uniref:5-demethoxyubiquinone hydroxylase, mitochondrial n=1 Tax=Laticauda laticaudata TaxID=8630 RepID=A0A8C5REH1_LATLA